MNYNLYRLNTTDFEQMVQSLLQNILGNSSIIFGAGPDGGREATFSGSAPFPNEEEKWSGYWVIQAKYKTKEDNSDDYSWVEKNFKDEMKKFSRRGLKAPDNYIFLTNVVLTPKDESGGRDKIEALKTSYNYLIPNIFVGAYDEIARLLDNNRDVATAYSSFILPGDILDEVLTYFKRNNEKSKHDIQIFKKYLDREFKDERTSKLIDAGDFTHSVNLENVFIDLAIKPEINSDQKLFALDHIVQHGNESSRAQSKPERYVLIGGAGSGKSTVTQFTSQLYIAYFLKNVCNYNVDYIDKYIEECEKLEITIPTCYRLPFKIILKDYAGWINETKGKNPISIVNYLINKIYIETGEQIDISIIKEYLIKLSFVFIFDGLDEVPVTSNRNIVLREISDFIDIELYEANCDAIIIATTRPQGYTSEFNKDKFSHYYMADMTDKICFTYLNKLLLNVEISEEKRRTYLKTLRESLKNESTSNLMRTPLQATIMTVLIVTGGEPSSNKYGLFSEYYQVIFKREKQKQVSKLLNLYERHINKIHNYLGFKLQSDSENTKNLYSSLDKKDFEAYLIQYLEEDQWDQKDISKFVDEFRRVITHRLVFIAEVQDDKIGFAIRSIQEFFAANYYMNIDDVTVKKRLRRISINSYWRNTLLFCVGYILTSKDHLIDYVSTLCEELNGMDLEPSEENFKSVVKFGSWLSLDILSEGILNDSRALTNTFSRYLEPLITLPYNLEHNKFNRLQNFVKEKWILGEYLTKVQVDKLNRSQQRTFFNIAADLLLSNDKSIRSKAETFLKNNISPENSDLVLPILNNNQLIHGDFIKILEKSLTEIHPLRLSAIFDKDLNTDGRIFNKIFNNKENSLDVKRALVEAELITFIRSTFLHRSNKNTLIKTLSTLSEHKIKLNDRRKIRWSIFDFCVVERTVQVYTDLYVTYNLLTKINIHLYESVASVADKYGIKYVSMYCKYNISPSVKSLKNFLTEFQKLSQPLKSRFNNPSNDWVIGFLIGKPNVSHKDVDELLNIIGPDYESWLNKENELLSNLNFDETIYFSNGLLDNKINSPNDFINEFFNRLSYSFKSEPLKDTYIQTILGHVSDSDINKNFHFSVSDNLVKPIAISLLHSDCNIHYEFDTWINSWLLLIKNSNSKLLFDLLNEHDYFNLLKENLLFRVVFSIDQLGVRKAFSIFNAFLELEISNNIIRLIGVIQNSARSVHRKFLNEVLQSINYDALNSVVYDTQESQVCQFLLMLNSPFPMRNDLEFMIERIEYFSNTYNSFLLRLISIISSLNISNGWQIDLVSEFISRTERASEKYFEEPLHFNYLKSFYEALSADVNNSSFK